MSEWLVHLKKFYADRKKTNPSYSYKKAMKDAVSSYKSSKKRRPSKRRGRTIRRRK